MISCSKLSPKCQLEELVNTGDVSRFPEFLAPDYRVRYTDRVGIEAARQHLLTFHHCYPDLVVTVDGQVAEDDIVVTWYTMRGTHLGEWGGIEPTHKVLTLRGVNVQRIRDGRIVEQWGGANTLEACSKSEQFACPAIPVREPSLTVELLAASLCCGNDQLRAGRT